MQRWRFLDTGEMSPVMNMAIDEAILTAHSEGRVPPTVRFYTWRPATLSIGYFQKAVKEIDMDKVREKGLGFVRRPTGGRAVLHDKELTYSVVVSANHPLMPSSVAESYRVLSTGLVSGFRNLGLAASMVSRATEEEKHKYATPGSAACFDSPSWYELIVAGRKVVGSAQMRQKGVILQHGSILLELDADLLFQLLKFSSETLRQKMRYAFERRAVAINQLRRPPVTLDEAVRAFYEGFVNGLKVELVASELTAYEQELAQELAVRYASETWNFRR